MTEEKEKPRRKKVYVAERGDLFPGIEVPDFVCPHCGEVINGEFYAFYRRLQGLVRQKMWTLPGSDKRRLKARERFLEDNPMHRKYRKEPVITDEDKESRRKRAQRASDASLAVRRQWREDAENDVEAQRNLRRHLMMRLQNHIRRFYRLMKPLLANVGGVMVNVSYRKVSAEVRSPADVVAYINSKPQMKRTMDEKRFYKLNMTMEDGAKFGMIYRRTKADTNTAVYAVYGVDIPDDFTDVPDVPLKFIPKGD